MYVYNRLGAFREEGYIPGVVCGRVCFSRLVNSSQLPNMPALYWTSALVTIGPMPDWISKIPMLCFHQSVADCIASEVGDGLAIQLFHDLQAVDGDSLVADVQFTGDFLSV